MKILYGTGNPAKLSAMKRRLEKFDIELIGLNDLKAKGIIVPNVPEDELDQVAVEDGFLEFFEKILDGGMER